MVEKEMRPIVQVWLENRGFEVTHELCFCNAYCDMLAFLFHERMGRRIPELKNVVVVELKIKDTSGVICQAERNLGGAYESWAAMPKDLCNKMQPRTLECFVEKGLGLLAVEDDCDVRIWPNVIKPSSWNRTKYYERLRRKLWRYHLHPQKKGRK